MWQVVLLASPPCCAPVNFGHSRPRNSAQSGPYYVLVFGSALGPSQHETKTKNELTNQGTVVAFSIFVFVRPLGPA